MSKNVLLITIGLAIIAILIAGFLYFSQRSPSLKETPNITEELNLKTADNPTEALPEINPVQKANPFSDTYTNPFK